MVGFVTFVAMDKGLRIATGGQGHDHSHESVEVVKPSSTTSALEDSPAKSTRSRNNKKADGSKDLVVVKESKEKEINSSVKLAGYLNLM